MSRWLRLVAVTGVMLVCFGHRSSARSLAEDVLFEDRFDEGLSPRWEAVGLDATDYRVRDGGLEIRLRPAEPGKAPYLKVALPFKTAETVIASVDVHLPKEALERNALAGMCLVDSDGPSFSVRKTNIDGYHVLAPGQVDFIGKDGEEGDPGKYTVKYWPADAAFGPLRIVIRGDYAHFQTGPSEDGKYRTYFHSAIREASDGLGFALMAVGAADNKEQWVRFDNFRVERN